MSWTLLGTTTYSAYYLIVFHFIFPPPPPLYLSLSLSLSLLFSLHLHTFFSLPLSLFYLTSLSLSPYVSLHIQSLSLSLSASLSLSFSLSRSLSLTISLLSLSLPDKIVWSGGIDCRSAQSDSYSSFHRHRFLHDIDSRKFDKLDLQHIFCPHPTWPITTSLSLFHLSPVRQQRFKPHLIRPVSTFVSGHRYQNLLLQTIVLQSLHSIWSPFYKDWLLLGKICLTKHKEEDILQYPRKIPIEVNIWYLEKFISDTIQETPPPPPSPRRLERM